MTRDNEPSRGEVAKSGFAKLFSRSWFGHQIGNNGSLRRQIVNGSLGTFALKLTHLVCAFAITVLLARFMGANGYGVYAYVFALINVLAIPVQFGLPVLTVRETAKCQLGENWGEMKGLWRWANLAIIVLSGTIALIGWGISWTYADYFSDIVLITFAIGLLVVPFIALGNLRGGALRGLRKVLQGQLPEEIVRPILTLSLVGLFLLAQAKTNLTPVHGMAAQLVATIGAYLVGVYLLNHYRPREFRQAQPIYRSHYWIISSLPLILTAGALVLTKNVDIIMLGWFVSSEEVGIYRVSVQLAMLAAFGLKAINMVVAPYFARLYRLEDYDRLHRLAVGSARFVFIFSFPVLLIFIWYGESIIVYVFGPQFRDSYTPLVILALAQFINASVGSVGYLLNMTSNEAVVARSMIIALIINIVMNALLIPNYEEIGAAIATGLSLATWNIILWVETRKRLGIDSSILGIRVRERKYEET